MSQTTTITLLPQTTATVVGDKLPAAAYYVAGRTMQTLTWKCTAFIGICTVQGTLVDDPQTEKDWFTVYNIVCTVGNGNGGTVDNPKVGYTNVVGNFAWLRASITTYTSGTVDYVKATY